jgi:hypothetical protein
MLLWMKHLLKNHTPYVVQMNACILKIIQDEIKRLEDIDSGMATIESDEDFGVYFITKCELKALREEYNKLLDMVKNQTLSVIRMETKVKFLDYDCIVEIGQYPNGRIAIQLIDAEDRQPVTTATVNLPDQPLEADMVAIKNYSENEGIEDALLEAGVLVKKLCNVVTGFASVPVYRINPELIG